MPLIQGAHDRKQAIATIAIVDATKYKEHKQGDRSLFQGAVPFNALLDTGATQTMITTRVVKRLGLQPIGSVEVSGVAGTAWRLVYLFHVAFYDKPPKDPSERSRIMVLKAAISGGELTGEHSFDVLLGMDVLTTGTLIINKNEFRFRFGENDA